MESRQLIAFLKLAPSPIGLCNRSIIPNPNPNPNRLALLTSNYLGHCLPHQGRGQGHRKLSTKSQPQPSSPSPKKGQIVEDDTSYFKRLGKTTNHYWTDNADQVLRRLNLDRLVDPDHNIALRENLSRRYCDDKIDLDDIRTLWGRWNSPRTSAQEREDLAKKLVGLVLWVPNDTHPASLDGDAPVAVKVHGQPGPSHEVVEFQKYCDKHNWLKNDNLGNIANHRSYFLKGPLAELEDALVRYALDAVKKSGFQLISVPDIIYPHVIESCGMKTRSERDQVFWVELPDSPSSEVCLSGTAEMSIGGSLQNRTFSLSSLPLKLAAVSRCYRAETSSVEEERGLYRVHEFTKVELFGVTSAETRQESSKLHQEILELEESLFSELGIHFKILEMPPSELGLPASRKFDIEAWMPGRKMFGEISSCSNCTDFQSRRLNIRYKNEGKQKVADTDALNFVHTVNGTAIAIPRMLITLIETHQQPDGSIKLPSVLEKFMTRPWSECVTMNPKFTTNFLRTKTAQMKYTRQFREMELDTN